MSAPPSSPCPGCGVELPRSGRVYDFKFHASAECWALFEIVIAREFQNPALFGQVHQLTVDTYAVQHAGGRHPDKSVCVHLVGLYAAREKGLAPAQVREWMRRAVDRESWPHLEPPERHDWPTVRDVAEAESGDEHARRVRAWADAVWQAWSPHHGVARELVGDVASGRARER